jgi:hypothetical protein
LTVYEAQKKLTTNCHWAVAAIGATQYDLETAKNLKLIQEAKEADFYLLRGTYAMHRLTRYLFTAKLPEEFSSLQQKQQWDVRMRPFWRIADPAPPSWEEVKLSALLEYHEVDETLIQALSDIQLAQKLINERGEGVWGNPYMNALKAVSFVVSMLSIRGLAKLIFVHRMNSIR